MSPFEVIMLHQCYKNRGRNKMARRHVMFTFPQELIREPIIYNLGQQFRVVTNIRVLTYLRIRVG